MRKSFVLLAAIVAVVGIVVPAASAGVVKYTTSMHNGHKERFLYHGSVQSEVRRCEHGRRVDLFKVRPGADRKVGHDRSSKSGWWTFSLRGGEGSFIAKAQRKVLDDGDVCLGDRAPVVKFV